MNARRTILVGMLQETGHLNPTFKLMRTLRGRGHRVVYSAIPDLEAHIQAQGFETLSWFPELFPNGSIRAQAARGLLARRRAITERFEALTERVVDGTGAAGHVAAAKPDLILADIHEPHLALLAKKLRIPLLTVNTSLPQTKAQGVAPLRTPLPFEPTLKGRLRAELSWQRFLASRRVGAKLADLIGMCPPYELARRMSTRFGVAAAELDVETVYFPQLRSTPEIVLCPECFDFPRDVTPSRHYVESVDLERQGQSFDFGRIPDDKPLVYCALGGQLYRPRQTPEFFRRMVQVFARKPEWRLLLSLGRHMSVGDLGRLPPNVHAMQSVPQLAVLERARVMVTHGGLGSVKECILFGVPMVVIPLAIDQPGNAARVVYHGIGVAGDVARSSVDELSALVTAALTEPAFRARIEAMQAQFRRLERATRGADLVETMLSQPSS